jgi:hypothetical protein
MLASNALRRRSISMLIMPLNTHWAPMSVPGEHGGAEQRFIAEGGTSRHMSADETR